LLKRAKLYASYGFARLTLRK